MDEPKSVNASWQACGHHPQYWNGHYCERCAEIADEQESAVPSPLTPGSVDWVESVKATPPEHESVLMWYLGTDRISAWSVVDKWHNRRCGNPDFWARINPPNAREKRGADSAERLVGLRDCKPVPDGTRVACLPGGFVLLNATPTETRVIELYAAECLRLKPPEIIVECQPAGSGAATGSATPDKSPCEKENGFISHPVSLVETSRGPRWKCRRCGQILESLAPNDQAQR